MISKNVLIFIIVLISNIIYVTFIENLLYPNPTLKNKISPVDPVGDPLMTGMSSYLQGILNAEFFFATFMPAIAVSTLAFLYSILREIYQGDANNENNEEAEDEVEDERDVEEDIRVEGGEGNGGGFEEAMQPQEERSPEERQRG